MSYIKSFASTVTCLVLAGCSYENTASQYEQIAMIGTDISNPQELEIPARETLLSAPISQLALYTFRVSEGYKNAGDDIAAQRDLISTGVIALAGGTALAQAKDIGAEQIISYLAAGAVADEGIKYIQSSRATQSFYDASEAMACISTAATQFDSLKGTYENTVTYPYANSLILKSVRAVEVGLRSGLERNSITFSDTLAAINKSLGREEDENGFAGSGEEQTLYPIQILATALDACVNKYVASSEAKSGAIKEITVDSTTNPVAAPDPGGVKLGT